MRNTQTIGSDGTLYVDIIQTEVSKVIRYPYFGTDHRFLGRVMCGGCNKIIPKGKGKFKECPSCGRKLIWGEDSID